MASAAFTSFTYTDAAHHPLTLTAQQQADILAVEVPLTVTQTPGNTNNGSASWTYSLADSNFDFLAAGEILTLTYTATVDDGHGGVVSQPITITITGTNDTPVITSATQTGTITELSNPSQPNPTGSTASDTATGAVTFTDADLSDTHTVTVTDVAASGTISGLPDNATLLSWLSLGTLTDTTGTGTGGSDAWTFSAQDKSFDYLAAGETVTLAYTVQVDDGHGGLVSQPVTITITGTNDTPVITSDAQTGTITELSNPSQPNPTGSTAPDTATGAVTFTDADLSDTHTVTVADVAASGTISGLPDNATLLSWLSLGTLTDTTGTGTGGSDAWTFSAQDHSFDYLAAGETVTLTYTVQVDDGHGGLVSQPVTITITGTNDTPVITSATQTGTITELSNPTGSTAPDTATGAVTFTDADLSDHHAVTVTHVAASGTISGLPTNETLLSWLSLGTLTDTTGTGTGGSDAWTFSAQDHSFDYLAAGQTVTLTYTVQVDDGHGGLVSQPVTITITGTNDTPVITSATQTGTITELSNPTGSTAPDTATGAVTFTDADLSDTHTVTVTHVAASGTISGLPTNETLLSWLSLGALTDTTGTGTGGSDAWTFSAQDHSFDYLAAGETVTLTYTVQVDDGHGGLVSQPVTITITGTNDTPVITSATQTGTINELSNPTGSTAPDTATGAVTFTDADLSDHHTVTVTHVAASGTISGLPTNETLLSWLSLGALTDTTGTGTGGSDAWTFSAQDHSFDYLAAGETVTLTYTVQVDDGHGGVVSQPITITITGTNDTPVITSATQTGTINELSNPTGSTAPDTATGAVTFTDADLSDHHAVTVTHVAASGTISGLPDNATLLSWLSLGTLTDTTGTGTGGSDAWTFSAQDHSFDYLAAGETVTLTYTVQVDDGHGGLVSQPVTITITGTNDTPVITSATQTGTITELSNPTGSTAPDTATGAVTFTDADLSDHHAVTVTHVAASGTISGLPTNETLLSWLSLGTLTDTTGTGTGGSDAWTFSAQDHSFDYLAAGQTVTLTYTVQVDDGHGGLVSQPVTITITGTNDTPVITSATQTGTITELSNPTGSTAPDTATGAVTFTDADLSDHHAVTVTHVAASGTISGLPTNETLLSWLSLGTLTDTTGTGTGGSDAWTFSAQDHSFDYLAAGETVTLTYTVQVDDGHGGVVSQPVTVTITGTNDAPTIVAGSTTATGTIGEIASTTGSSTSDSTAGSIAFADADLSDTHTVSKAAPSFAWSGGALTAGQIAALTSAGTLALTEHDSTGTGAGSVAWNYSAQDKSFDFLAAGQTLIVTYNVTVTDNNGLSSTQPVTVTITGTNDAPTIVAGSTTATGAIGEIAATTGSSTSDSTAGSIAFADADLSDTHTVSKAAPTLRLVGRHADRRPDCRADQCGHADADRARQHGDRGWLGGVELQRAGQELRLPGGGPDAHCHLQRDGDGQ